MAVRKKSPPRKPSPPVKAAGAERGNGPAGRTDFPVVGVGASAGGLEAFTRLLNALPADTGMALVLVQHLDPTYESRLPEILSRATALPVRQVTQGLAVEPDTVYVIPPGCDLSIRGRVLDLSPRTDGRGQQRGIDLFFRSLAADVGHQAIGVILSGSASDGTLGLAEIKAEGGITFAQDESAQQASMPRHAIGAGCVDFVLTPEGIAHELGRIARHPYIAPAGPAAPEELAGNEMDQVLEPLLRVTGVDFRPYKRTTLYRRITRRVVLHKLPGVAEYVRLLREDPREVESLHQDILINVTSFFRNPEAFEHLKARTFPALTEQRSRHEPIRVWVLGCSTGEEAFSLAMAYTEFAEATGRTVPIQIFATDLNGACIERARSAIYSRGIVGNVSPERLRRFFTEVDGSYRVTKALREQVIFAQHNVLTAPPFSHLDLVSCRNLLIYLDPEAQARLLALLHYALRPGGHLWLGASETIGGYRDLFDSQENRFKVYVRKPGAGRPAGVVFPRSHVARPAGEQRPPRTEPLAAPDPQREADRVLLARYAPAAVLVNESLEILQFRGDTGPYLTPAPGRATFELLKMLRPGLVVAVRGALQRAAREEAPAREEGLRVRGDGGSRDVNVEVVPVGRGSAQRGGFLVLFEEAGSPAERRGHAARERLAVDAAETEDADRELVRLRQELVATREYLQSVIEQQEAANEELQSANEEVQSSNEELQSINEELQTSKEEIQSSNEELATLNDELQERNLELARSNDDFTNLLSSVQLAIVMLGPDLRIRRFTPAAEKMLNLMAADAGRPVADLRLPIEVDQLERLVTEVIDTVTVRELEVRDRQGHWYLLRIRPYRTLEHRIDGAVLVLVDVDALKRNAETLRRQSELLERTHEPILTWEPEGPGTITYWNRGAARLFGYTSEEVLGRGRHELLKGSVPPGVIREALDRDGWWTGEVTYTGKDGLPVVVESRISLVRDLGGEPAVIEADWPIAERKRMEEMLRGEADALLAADRKRNEFLLTLAHELRNPLGALRNAAMVLGTPGAGIATIERARELMRHQIQNMARLIDDLTDVSRIARGEIAFRSVRTDVLAAVRNAVESARAEADARGIALTASLPDLPAELDGDPLRLEQVFGNLLANAARFGTENGHIWVQAEIRLEDGRRHVVVTIRDDGPGISPAELPRVFDLFARAGDAEQRAPGGLGIGLTLVRRIVELHGGTVEAFSAGPGHGSEFAVQLPIATG